MSKTCSGSCLRRRRGRLSVHGRLRCCRKSSELLTAVPAAVEVPRGASSMGDSRTGTSRGVCTRVLSPSSLCSSLLFCMNPMTMIRSPLCTQSADLPREPVCLGRRPSWVDEGNSLNAQNIAKTPAIADRSEGFPSVFSIFHVSSFFIF